MVIVRKGAMEKINEALRTHCQETSKFQMICIDDDEDVGTAEAMVLIKDKTKVILSVPEFREIIQYLKITHVGLHKN